MGRVPVSGDVFEMEGYRFEVVDMDEKRVDKVLVSRITTPAENKTASHDADKDGNG
jgi:putative hemolysin